MGHAAMKHANPYAGLVGSLTPGELDLLSDAVEEHRLREEVGFGTLAEAAELYRPSPRCPRCGSGPAWGDGFEPSGVRRWRRPSCGARFTSLTGTVLEGCRKPLATWVSFIRLALFAVPLDACAEMCRISHHTAWEWRHRLFAAVDGYQDRIVLRGRVWVDETYVNDTDLSHGYGQARKRGLSKQKVCIAVGIDARKEPVAVVCGHGKPSSARIRRAMGAHVAKGATLVHDRERAHNVLVRENSLEDESYKADVRDPAYLEAMALVNNLCSWIKRYLWRFTGMDPKNLQSYLNLYVYLFRVKRGGERWPKVARVVRHLLMTDATFRS
ncbi:IS1595 family transposase [Collinsella sp. An271]|uniref:IS1595 family transposase n=1 Tax=Collinsella sp. An271 TaxID=1965616 RepID=UPI0019516757|nr:IS1595 family transposase [Collinsella sp. An271]